MPPIFRSTPAFEVGMPVVPAIFCFACVMPKALFHEKERPGMPVFDFFAIYSRICVLIKASDAKANIQNNPYQSTIIVSVRA